MRILLPVVAGLTVLAGCGRSVNPDTEDALPPKFYNEKMLSILEGAQAEREGDNGWVPVLSACEKDRELSSDDPKLDDGPSARGRRRQGTLLGWARMYRSGIYDSPDDEAWAEQLARKSIAKWQEAGVYDLFIQGAECPRFVPAMHESAVLEIRGDHPVNLGSTRMRWIARGMLNASELALRDGDQALAVRLFKGAAATPRYLAFDWTKLSFERAWEFADDVSLWVRTMLANGLIDADTASALLAIMEAQWQFPSRTEYAALGRLIAQQAIDHAILEDSSGSLAARDDLMAKCAERWGRFDAIASLPFDARESVALAEERSRWSGDRYRPLQVSLTGWPRDLDDVDRYEQSCRATRLMLALEVYRGLHGKYPDSLSELVPEVLPEVPVDPVACTQTWGYERELAPLGTSPGFAYTMYSIGANGTDDGGTAPAGHMEQANDREEPQGDYVYTAELHALRSIPGRR